MKILSPSSTIQNILIVCTILMGPSIQAQPVTEPVDLTDYQQVKYVSITTGSDVSGDGSTSLPWKTLSYALTKATDASSTKAYAILIASGSYTSTANPVFTMLPWVDLFGGYDPLTWTRDININRTILHGDRIRSVVNGASNSTIDGVTIQEGGNTGTSAGYGIKFKNTSYSVVSNCTVTLNASTSSGGGINAILSILSLKNDSIVENRADSDGGGLYASSSAITMTGCMISDNSSSNKGGGIHFYSTSSARLTDCMLENNSSYMGGAIFYDSSSSVLTGCTLNGNSTTGNGGAIHAEYGILRINQCIISKNSTKTHGGGIFLTGYSNAHFTNCLLTDNTAVNSGGAISTSGSTLTLLNSSLVSNSASDAVALYIYKSTTTISNSILWNPGNEMTVSGTPVPTVQWSCIQGGWDGTGNISSYPRFNSLTDGDFHLENGSACIDSASATLAPAMDLEGTVRPGADAKADMGAYESPAEYLPSESISPTRYYINASIAVPGDGSSWDKAFRRIGDALIATDTTTEIWVASGTYNESLKLGEGIHLLGGFIGTETDSSQRVHSNAETVIDASGSNHSVIIAGERMLLDNLTITHGNATNGGGVCLYSITDATITNCIILSNLASNGGGIYCALSSPLISDSTFAGNTSYLKNETGGGGALYCVKSSPRLSRCLITSSSANIVMWNESGGSVYCNNSSPVFSNCLLTKNLCHALYCSSYSAPVLLNCTISGNLLGGLVLENSDPIIINSILWNHGSEIDERSISGHTPHVSDSCLQGGWTGEGNIDAYPHFKDPDNNDYSLLPGSPCIDGASVALAPSDDFTGTSRPGDDSLADMGAYESPSSYKPSTTPSPTRYYVVAGASPEASGLTWAEALPSVKQALRYATGGCEIWIKEGEYREQIITERDVKIYGGFTGMEESLSERNSTLHKSTIMEYPVQVRDEECLLDGLTITGGQAENGGGIYYDHVQSATLSNCSINGNYASLDGGGIFCLTSSPFIINCTICNNSANRSGGGFFCMYYSIPTFSNCLFAHNYAKYDGGGLNCTLESSMNASNCTFWDNQAYFGTALLVDYSVSATLSNCVFLGNKGHTPEYGPVIYHQNGSSPMLYNSIIWDNTPQNINSGDSTMISSTVFLAYCNVYGDWGVPDFHNINADPLFVDPENGDFHLQEGSPCIGKGIGPTFNSSVPLFDIDGDPHSGATCDIGVDEYTAPTAIQEWMHY